MELAQDTAATLAVKIQGYKNELATVKALADAEPDNAMYAKLVADMQQLVNMTTELVRVCVVCARRAALLARVACHNAAACRSTTRSSVQRRQRPRLRRQRQRQA